MTCRLLFLCTGNYYRSRFAEHLFNSLAVQSNLGWQATSRGVATEFGIWNVGPISSYAREGLAARGITLEEDLRMPMQLQESELAEADRIIALNEAEHRPQLLRRFPNWVDRVEYWHIPDLDVTGADVALPAIERHVQELIRRLR